MSQQINLLLPALRPRFDWLALPVVAGVALAGLVLISILAALGMTQAANLRAREAEIKSQQLAAQQQLQSLAQALAARQGDTSLEPQIHAARLAVTQRQEVLAVIAQGDVTQGNAYSGLLQGFSRQTVDGVWLLGFDFAGKEIEIQGRLLDPALLPTYINRLNGELVMAVKSPDAKERFATAGVEPMSSTPEEFGQFIMSEAARFGKVIKEAGIKGK